MEERQTCLLKMKTVKEQIQENCKSKNDEISPGLSKCKENETFQNKTS